MVYFANVMSTWSGDRLVHELLAHDAGEGILNTSQEPSLQ